MSPTLLAASVLFFLPFHASSLCSPGVSNAGSIPQSIEFFGHAYLLQNSPSDASFPSLVSRALGGPKANYGLPGAVLFVQPTGGLEDGGWANVLQTLPRTSRTAAPYLAGSHVTILMYGLTDLGVLGAEDLPPFEEAFRVVVARVRASAVFEDEHGSVSYPMGYWTPVSGPTPFYSGAQYTMSSDLGFGFSITLPSDFPGGEVQLGFINLSGVASAATIEMDEAPTLASFSFDAGFLPGLVATGFIRRIVGVSAGSHTIVVTPTAGVVNFDYWQIPAGVPGLVLVSNVARIPIPGPNQDDGSVANINSDIASLVAEWDPYVVLVDADATLNDNANLFTGGGILPNEAGEALLAGAFIRAFAANQAFFNPSRPDIQGPTWVELGYKANASVADSVAVGHGAKASAGNTVALGPNAQAIVFGGVALGKGATVAAGVLGIATGYGAISGNDGAVALGSASIASGIRGIALGQEANDGGFSNSMAFGYQTTCTASDQVLFPPTSTVVVGGVAIPSSSGAPVAGQVLTATSTTQAAWQTANNGPPIGSMAFGMSAPDATYLKADGQILNITTYPTLATQIGKLPYFSSSIKTVVPDNRSGPIDMTYSPDFNLFLANAVIAGFNHIYLSTDGTNWDSFGNTGLSSGGGSGVAYCSGLQMFIITSSSAFVWITTFSDAHAFTKVWLPTADATTSWVAASVTTIVVGGGSDVDNSIQNVWTSVDGFSWVKRPIGSTGTTRTVSAIHWSSAMSLFFLGFSDGTINTSPDSGSGAWTWTVVANSNFGGAAINQFASNATFVVAVGASGHISTSPDAVTWTARTTQTGTGLNGVAFSPTATIPWVASGSSILMTSLDGTTWNTMAASVPGRANIFYSPTDSQYVECGNFGLLATSTDLAHWTARVAAEPTINMNAGAYGAGVYVVCGGSGKIDSSADGVTWTLRTANAGSNTLNHVVYATVASSIFVATGASNVIVTSPDGVTWTSRTSNLASTGAAIAFNTVTIVTVGSSGHLVTSTDGVTWTSRTTNTGQNLNGVAWNGAVFCSVGARVVITSPDGITWTKQTPVGVPTTGTWTWLTSDGAGTFFGHQGTSLVFISSDCVSWTAYASAFATISSFNWMNSRLVGYTSNGDIATSTDGRTWTFPGNRRGAMSWGKAYWISSQNKYFILQGNAGFHTSSDGIIFNGRGEDDMTALVYSEQQNKLVVVGPGGNVMISTNNGITFTPIMALAGTTGAVTGLSTVTYSPSLNIFLAVGTGMNIQTSPDGLTWTQRVFTDQNLAVQAPSSCNAIWAAGPNLFVVVGDGGIIGTSPNGISWNSTRIAGGLFQVAYNPTVAAFVACGPGFISTSIDGYTWTTQNAMTYSGTGASAVASLGAKGFVIVCGGNGFSSTVSLTSPDGYTWHTNPTVTLDNLGPLMLSSTADGGVFLTSPGSGVSSYVLFTSDGLTFTRVGGFNQIAGGSTALILGQITYSSVVDAYFIAGIDGMFATIRRRFNATTQFALPVLTNTWVKATS